MGFVIFHTYKQKQNQKTQKSLKRRDADSDDCWIGMERLDDTQMPDQHTGFTLPYLDISFYQPDRPCKLEHTKETHPHRYQ